MKPRLKRFQRTTDGDNRLGEGPYLIEIMPGGGTDGGAFHTSFRGIPTMVIGVPVRYIHSHVSIVHRDDLENGVKGGTEVGESWEVASYKEGNRTISVRHNMENDRVDEGDFPDTVYSKKGFGRAPSAV
ncbi:hypothetical protein [Paenibacillus alkalitolerans]|uniref:hypothetical protein n=1 Tax=Paenibacillus alkalitolerans TaxID=2799335 RepID=UPI0018F68A0D|nr:hypothetical protein [Paenibacillus alkalitolerans]